MGSKLEPLHQAPCRLLHQSSEHQEYSQLCFRYSVPSVTPESPRDEGRPQAPIARLTLRLEDTVSTVCSSGLLLAHISALGPITAVVLTSKCFPNSSRNAFQSDLQPLKEKSSLQRTSLTIVPITFRYPTQMLNLSHQALQGRTERIDLALGGEHVTRAEIGEVLHSFSQALRLFLRRHTHQDEAWEDCLDFIRKPSETGGALAPVRGTRDSQQTSQEPLRD